MDAGHVVLHSHPKSLPVDLESSIVAITPTRFSGVDWRTPIPRSRPQARTSDAKDPLLYLRDFAALASVVRPL